MKKLICFVIMLFLAGDTLAQLATNAPWPMYQQNARHTGGTNRKVIGPLKKPILKWKCQIGGPIYAAPVIGLNGDIYIGNYNNNPWLRSISPLGKTNWSHQFGADYIFNSPIISSDGTLYFTPGVGDLYYAIDKTTGSLIWSNPIDPTMNYAFYSSGVLGRNGIIYLGDLNSKFFAVNKSDHSLKWTLPVDGVPSDTPALSTTGVLYFGDDQNNFYAVSTNGSKKWQIKTGGVIYSSPVIGNNGNIYFGCDDNMLYCIKTNGKTNWTYPVTGANYSSPAIGPDNNIYMGGSDNRLYALQNNGSLKWTFRIGTNYGINSSPTIGNDGTIYIFSGDGYLAAVSNAGSSGVLKWIMGRIGNSGSTNYSSPAIGPDGTLYVGGWDGCLYAFGENHAPVLSWSGNPGFTSSGVSPVNGKSGTNFRFEVKYKDKDNDPPSTNQIWLDVNNNGVYEGNEKFGMFVKSGTSYSNGVVYSNATPIYYTGAGTYKYRYYFADAYGVTPSITNMPFTNHIFSVTNGAFLSWAGTPGFTQSGVYPATNSSGSLFTFKVKYQERNNHKPITNQLWIDLNHNNIFEQSEKISMFSNAGTSYSNGMIYTNILPITFSGTNLLQYLFYYRTASEIALGAPFSFYSLGITPRPPAISWLGTGDYVGRGVDKTSGPSGDFFTFKIKYQNKDNMAPAAKQLWIDLNGDGNYNNEKFTMVSNSGTSYSNGIIYTNILPVTYKGKSRINFQFYFTDVFSIATNVPSRVSVLRVYGSDATLDQVIAGPVPVKRGAQNFRFERLTAQAQIDIYTISGELVKTLKVTTADGRVSWDLRNEAGVEVGRGIYLCKIANSKGEKKVIKIAVQ